MKKWIARGAGAAALAITSGAWGQPSGAPPMMPATNDGGGGSDAGAMLLGVVLVALPLVAGAALGRALRALRPPLGRGYAPLAAAVAIAIAALSLPAAKAIPSVGSWDVLLVGLWVATGTLVAALRAPIAEGARRERRIRAIASWAIAIGTLCALEGLSCVVLPKPPPFPPAREARLIVSFSDRDPPCLAMFPDATNLIEQRVRREEGRSVKVLHVGDSMVAGAGVSIDDAFPAVLDRLQPAVGHINAGASGAGLESDYIVAGRWVERIRVKLAVVHFFMGNDVHDIDRAYPCCKMGPLLDFSGAEPAQRCESLTWTFPIGILLTASPPPYPLRVASSSSRFAAHMTDAFGKVTGTIREERLFGAQLGNWTDQGREERFDKIERTFKALRAKLEREKVPLLLVLLPYRETLERASGLPPSANDVWGTLEEGQDARRKVTEAARRAGIDVIDAWDLLKDAIAREGVKKWFADMYPGDVHFSREGHELFAKWLSAELVKRGIGAEAGLPQGG